MGAAVIPRPRFVSVIVLLLSRADSLLRLRLDHPHDAVIVVAALGRGSVEGAVGTDRHITFRKATVGTSREVMQRAVHPAVSGIGQLEDVTVGTGEFTERGAIKIPRCIHGESRI